MFAAKGFQNRYGWPACNPVLRRNEHPATAGPSHHCSPALPQGLPNLLGRAPICEEARRTLRRSLVLPFLKSFCSGGKISAIKSFSTHYGGDSILCPRSLEPL